MRLAAMTATIGFARQACAQTKADLPLICFLAHLRENTEITRVRLAALRQGLQQQGLIEGKNYSLAMRFLEGDFSRIPQAVQELGSLKPKVVVVVSVGVTELKRSYPDLPIVFTAVAADPIALGWVQSYVHPGGMITGNVMNAVGGEETVTQKRIGLFKEIVPAFTKLGMIAPDGSGLTSKEKDALQKVADQFGFEFAYYGLKKIDDLEAAFAAGVRDDVSAFFISGAPILFDHMPRVIACVKESRKPSVGPYPEWGREGLLMSYSTDPLEGFSNAGVYAGMILKGARPAELPIQQASRFTLVINQKTAKSLSIVVPPSLLALADEIVE